MPKILTIDGIKFNLWIPQNEEQQFHPIIKEHSKDIFGEDSVYLDIGPRLKSEEGLGAEPDGFVINPVEKELYLVEVELSKHDVYKHINDQLTRFINTMDNPQTRNSVVDTLYNEINSNRHLRQYFDEKINDDLHRWLSVLLRQPPRIIVIIEEKTGQVVETCKILTKSYDTKILEFQTFHRENAPTVHAHFFEPLSEVGRRASEKEVTSRPARTITQTQKEYLVFFQELTARFKERVPTAQPSPRPQYYCQIPTGLGSVHFEWMFGGNPRNRLGVELHFEKGDKEANVRLLREMMKSKNEIETKAGEKVVFEENWGKTAARLYVLKQEGNLTEDLKKWAIEKMAILHDVLQPKLQAVK